MPITFFSCTMTPRWELGEPVLRLAEVLDTHPEVAAVCPLLVDEEGRPAPQLGQLPPSGEWAPAQPSTDEPFAVEYLGAVRRS